MSKKTLVSVSDKLIAQLENAEKQAKRLEARDGQTVSYWHNEARRLRQLIKKSSEVKDNGKLE